MSAIPGLDWWLTEPDDDRDWEAEEEDAWTRADEQYDRDLDLMLEARYERED